MKIGTKQSLMAAMGLAFATAFGAAVAQPDAASVCAECHGENGASSDASIPNIGGVGSFFLENQIILFTEESRPCVSEGFKDGQNHCTAIQGLSEDDGMALAEYYGEQDYVPFEQEFDAALAEQGAAIHAESCDRCHTAGGSEPFDDAGILAGQPIPYNIAQFKHYKAGERWQPESMAEVMDLSEEQMNALAHFYAAEGLK